MESNGIKTFLMVPLVSELKVMFEMLKIHGQNLAVGDFILKEK